MKFAIFEPLDTKGYFFFLYFFEKFVYVFFLSIIFDTSGLYAYILLYTVCEYEGHSQGGKKKHFIDQN